MYPRIALFKSPAALRERAAALGIELPLDDAILTAAAGSPLAQPFEIGGCRIGNRWCIHPMEGWDAERDGSPSPLTLRRWTHFGASGAKFIWGGEAAAVMRDGRANPRQLLAVPENIAGLKVLLITLTDAHQSRFGTIDDLFVGLQLTHSGRFSRPNTAKLEPRIAYHHPLLDERFGIDPRDDSVVWRDEDLPGLIDAYVRAAGTARDAGYRFVDVKACHGYLMHEFLSAHTRSGPYGGDFDGRTRLLCEIIGSIRSTYPDLPIVVRLSAFDIVPYSAPPGAAGRPMAFENLLPYRYGFGLDPNHPLSMDLTETHALIARLAAFGVAAINISCGSPYYNPHVQRPAAFPPSDGYEPPEDPLVGVARQIYATRLCKEAAPDMPIVGSGYTYLQDFLPLVAQAVVRRGWADFVGLGRMVLSYPEMPADVLQAGELARKLICRTFSDCTTAPRNGIVSGCFPLDAFYKQMAEAASVREIKREQASRTSS